MKDHSIISFRRRIISLFWLFIVFAKTFDTVKAQSLTDSANTQTFLNISYKKTAADSAIKLDIFLPDRNPDKKYPVLVIIHGGGWAEGDKTLEAIYYMQRLKSEMLRNGFAVISINYTLVGKDYHLPAPVEDSKDAIRWVRAHANEYRVDTSNIGLWGGSAGGHLALMAAYTSGDSFTGSPELARYSARVNYVIDNFGPTDLNKLFQMNLGWFSTFIAKLFYPKIYKLRERLVFAMTGYYVKEDKKKVKGINQVHSPINYVTKNAVPTIIFHGTKDKVVPITQSEELKKALDQASVTNEFITVKDGDHGFNNISHEETDQLIEQTIAWIKRKAK